MTIGYNNNTKEIKSMKKIGLDDLKQIELDMVKYLDKICKANSIHYYMVGGTLLGSVRHRGFIPWDDDIDVAMPRKDFIKLQKVFENDSSYYQLQFYNNIKNYGYSWPKMIDSRTTLIDRKLGTGYERSAVYLDIFLYDGMGNSKRKALLYYYFLKIFKKTVFLSKRNFKMENQFKTLFFMVPWIVCHLIGSDKLNVFFNSLAARRNFYDDKYVACVSGRYGRKELFCRGVFEKTIELPFEDTILPAPIKYEKYLKSLYGNFMELPPIDKQISNHTTEKWWNDEKEALD